LGIYSYHVFLTFCFYPIHLIPIAIESFDDDDEAEAVDKEEYLTDLEEIKEEGESNS